MVNTLQVKLKEKSFLIHTLNSSLILFYIFDCINKYLIVNSNEFSASIVIRAFYELVFIAIIILFINKQRWYFLLGIFMLYGGFLIGQIAFRMNYKENYDFIFHSTLFVKYTFVFVIYFASYKIIKSPDALDKCCKYLERIFVINSSLAVIGFLFNIQVFKSYPELSYRFGYSGLIPAINEATLFYTIGIFYFYHKVFIKKIKDKKIFIFFVSCLLLGAKGIYVMIALLAFYHFITTTSKRVMNNVIIISVFFISAFVIYLTTKDARVRFEFFFRIAEENGLITMLLSGRDIAIRKNVFKNMEEWNILNFLFGGQDQGRLVIEMDLIDLFLLFGIMGSFLYLYFLFKTIFSFKKTSFNKFFIFAYLFLAALGGHFFPSAVNALYLVIFSLLLKYESQIKENPYELEGENQKGLI